MPKHYDEIKYDLGTRVWFTCCLWVCIFLVSRRHLWIHELPLQIWRVKGYVVLGSWRGWWLSAVSNECDVLVPVLLPLKAVSSSYLIWTHNHDNATGTFSRLYQDITSQQQDFRLSVSAKFLANFFQFPSKPKPSYIPNILLWLYKDTAMSPRGRNNNINVTPD